MGWGGITWPGSGLEEVGVRSINDVVIKVDPRYFRPAEVDTLLGNPTKAHEKLGWKPTSSLEELVSEMISYDLEIAKKEAFYQYNYNISKKQ